METTPNPEARKNELRRQMFATAEALTQDGHLVEKAQEIFDMHQKGKLEEPDVATNLSPDYYWAKREVEKYLDEEEGQISKKDERQGLVFGVMKEQFKIMVPIENWVTLVDLINEKAVEK